tara:strand:+ start:354 stop:1226 length:873 start_codon:yes stop_codon:yes gene_type:complete
MTRKYITIFLLCSFFQFEFIYAQGQQNDFNAIITQTELEIKIKELKESKLLVSPEDNKSHKEIDQQIKNIEDKINALNYIETSESKQYLGTPIFDKEDFWKLIIKGVFNLIIVLLIVRYIYYPITRNKDYLFTYLLISLTVFLLCFLLDNVKLQLGFALGLFAIFGIIRYRTDPIPIKEMTYLFLVIGISVVNALANRKISYAELIFANLLLVFVTYGMERLWLLKHESRKNITYEKIDLIKPEKRNELIEDLSNRTGIDIIRVEIRRVDFLRDIANIRIFYYDDDPDKG